MSNQQSNTKQGETLRNNAKTEDVRQSNIIAGKGIYSESIIR